ncbi:SsrA-binding protein SmpB [Patescibacteria group bacterium]
MRVINRKARYDYNLLEKFEAGIVLTGAEVKSAKLGRIKLEDSFIRVDHNLEAWLVNAHIHPYSFANNKNYQPTKSRKLLLHRKEILSLVKKMEGKNMSIVPTLCYQKKGKIKLQLALAKGKKSFQKKEKKRKQDLDREMERDLKNF